MVNQCSHLSNLPTQMVLETELTEVSVSDAVVTGNGRATGTHRLVFVLHEGRQTVWLCTYTCTNALKIEHKCENCAWLGTRRGELGSNGNMAAIWTRTSGMSRLARESAKTRDIISSVMLSAILPFPLHCYTPIWSFESILSCAQ